LSVLRRRRQNPPLPGQPWDAKALEIPAWADEAMGEDSPNTLFLLLWSLSNCRAGIRDLVHCLPLRRVRAGGATRRHRRCRSLRGHPDLVLSPAADLLLCQMVNFSCPLNTVPKHSVDEFLQRSPRMREAWEESGYQL
jgi:hypothetical protein